MPGRTSLLDKMIEGISPSVSHRYVLALRQFLMAKYQLRDAMFSNSKRSDQFSLTRQEEISIVGANKPN